MQEITYVFCTDTFHPFSAYREKKNKLNQNKNKEIKNPLAVGMRIPIVNHTKIVGRSDVRMVVLLAAILGTSL